MLQAATKEDLQDLMDHVAHLDTRVPMDLPEDRENQVTYC